MRRIARALRGWREAYGEQSGAVAKRAGWSAAKQSRLETGGQAIVPSDVMTLALIYEVSEEERDKVFHAALAAQEKGWWEELTNGALVDDMYDYVELESEAARLQTFKIDLVHGIFQTRQYAEAVMRAFLPRPAEDTIQGRIDARLRRQDRLLGDRPLATDAVIAEAALRIIVGGPDVMRAQLARLRELAELPHIHLRVMPSSAGAHTSMGADFNILSFGAGMADVVYLESLHRGVYLEELKDVTPYKVRFAGLWEHAMAEEESAALVAKIAHAMRA
ncbi:MAG: helix-turn-helix domain-containing protein [Candidatus Limnocylindria bacterium]